MKTDNVFLITGGAGFIGSHLCCYLLRKGHKVICLDNFVSGTMDNIKPLLSNNNFQLIKQSVIEPISCHADIIINLASIASPKFYQKYPIDTFKTNVYGAINLLELANKNNATILQASTSEVYGDPQPLIQNERYWGNVNPIGIRSCYNEGKRAAESIFMDFHRIYHTKIKIARIFNCYGPKLRSDDGRIVSTFILQALKNKNLTVYGDGTQTRCLCYIDDMLEGIYKLIQSNDNIIGPINLGNPQEQSVIQIAKLIIGLTNSKSNIEYYPLPADDPKHRCPDISLAQQLLNWNPTTDIIKGIKKTIAYYQNTELPS